MKRTFVCHAAPGLDLHNPRLVQVHGSDKGIVALVMGCGEGRVTDLQLYFISVGSTEPGG